MAQVAQQEPLLSPAEIGVSNSVAGAGQTMIGDVARSGSSQETQSVETFQILWNDYRDVLNGIFTKIGAGPVWFKLEEDGRYGKNTAKALGWVTGGASAGFKSSPPRYASGVPVWYAQNKDAVDAMAPMNIASDEMPPVNQPTGPPVPSGQVAQEEVDRARSGALVQDLVDPNGPVPAAPLTNPVCDPGVNLPAGCGWTSPTAWSCPPDVTAAQLRASGCYDASEERQPMEQKLVFDENGGVKVIATPTRGLTPFLALAVGAAALGGTLWWFTRKPRRRRAA